MKKLKEWFAVKRTKDSKTYQFYPPNKHNRETIAAIAPECGNFEEIVLCEKTAIEPLRKITKRAMRVLSRLPLSITHNIEFYDCEGPNCYKHCPACEAIKVLEEYESMAKNL